MRCSLIQEWYVTLLFEVFFPIFKLVMDECQTGATYSQISRRKVDHRRRWYSWDAPKDCNLVSMKKSISWYWINHFRSSLITTPNRFSSVARVKSSSLLSEYYHLISYYHSRLIVTFRFRFHTILWFIHNTCIHYKIMDASMNMKTGKTNTKIKKAKYPKI